MAVAILLATRNGALFLEDQLRSLQEQTVESIDVFVSDDGSTDRTRDILSDWASRWNKGRFEVVNGPLAGRPVDNFRALILNRPLDGHDFVAYADQDDIWLPHKLARAMANLRTLPDDAPAVHCARTQLIDEAGRSIGYSRLFRRPPAFRNALVQSLAGGNTMVMNRAAFSLVSRSMQRGPCVAHDWWTYQIVTGAGGRMLYAAEPDTLYRQHDDNAVGSNRGVLATVSRIGLVLGGRMRQWNEVNLATLGKCRDLLTADAQMVLAQFGKAREGSVIGRLRHLGASGIYRQTARGQMSLWGACALALL